MRCVASGVYGGTIFGGNFLTAVRPALICQCINTSSTHAHTVNGDLSSFLTRRWHWQRNPAGIRAKVSGFTRTEKVFFVFLALPRLDIDEYWVSTISLGRCKTGARVMDIVLRFGIQMLFGKVY